LRAFIAVVAVAALGAGCGSSGSSASSSLHSSSNPTTPSSGPASSGSSTTAAKVRNLVASNAVRAQLLAAGAALHQLPVKDYTGLVKGDTYYAYDPGTGVYWAGAALAASPKSMRAQVGDQDDGAYLDFEKQPGGSWKAYDAGVPGSSNYSCAVTIPPAVVSVWDWAAGTCHPSS
jgi:hypothetical protein